MKGKQLVSCCNEKRMKSWHKLIIKPSGRPCIVAKSSFFLGEIYIQPFFFFNLLLLFMVNLKIGSTVKAEKQNRLTFAFIIMAWIYYSKIKRQTDQPRTFISFDVFLCVGRSYPVFLHWNLYFALKRDFAFKRVYDIRRLHLFE